MTTHRLVIPRWHPARLNLWDGRHWAFRSRMKRQDRDFVAVYARQQGIPRATGARLVGLEITLAPGQRGADVDAYWKTTLDALKHAGLIVDDSRQHVQLLPVRFERGPEPQTVIVLTDLPVPTVRVAGERPEAGGGGPGPAGDRRAGRDGGTPANGLAGPAGYGTTRRRSSAASGDATG